MKIQLFSFCVLLATAFSGCTESGGLTTDFITPGQWHVGGNTDHILAWAHNGGSDSVDIEWSLSAVGGHPLPAAWDIKFSEESATLDKKGTKVQGGRGFDYTDWARTLITIKVPADEPAGTHDVELHAGDAVRTAQLIIGDNRTKVSGPGSDVTVSYEGRFTDNDEVFDAGSFPTSLGSGQTVAGFDYGLMGLAVGEEAELILPAAYAYGYDVPAGSRLENFSGRSLTFVVEITKLE